jgi:prevent-host-death family protein
MSASTFKATCLEVMDHIARTGREVVVTKHGRPVVRIAAADAAPASPWGFLKGSIVRHGDIVSPDHESWSPSPTDPLGGSSHLD